MKIIILLKDSLPTCLYIHILMPIPRNCLDPAFIGNYLEVSHSCCSAFQISLKESPEKVSSVYYLHVAENGSDKHNLDTK